MIYRKLIVLASLLIGFVNIAFAGVGDLDTLNVRSQAPVKERMPVVAYKFNPKSLILPASLITVGAVGTAIDGMNDFHLFSRKDSVKQIHIDNYLEWGMLGWVFVCDLMGTEKHNWVDQLCLVALAEGMNGLMVHGLKNWVNEPRPDGAPKLAMWCSVISALLNVLLDWLFIFPLGWGVILVMQASCSSDVCCLFYPCFCLSLNNLDLYESLLMQILV